MFCFCWSYSSFVLCVFFLFSLSLFFPLCVSPPKAVKHATSGVSFVMCYCRRGDWTIGCCFKFFFFFFFLWVFFFSLCFLDELLRIGRFHSLDGEEMETWKIWNFFFLFCFVFVFFFFVFLFFFKKNLAKQFSIMHSEETNYFVNDSIWLDNFNDLDTSETTIVEYVWIGGTGQDLRSKARSFPGKPPKSHLDCPEWNFDGSSTGQAPGNDSEILLRPVAMFRDPFRRDPHKVRREEKNKRVRERSSSKRKKKKKKNKNTKQKQKLVMCECYKVDGTPALHNNRAAAVPVFEAVKDHHPWFGLEQVLKHLMKVCVVNF